MMDFGVSLSGLNAASADISAISNNIANASTVGFKSVLTDFAASYLPNVNGTSPDPGGAGVVIVQTTQLFSQGTINPTSNALDVAIDGNGFFQLSDNGNQKFTRNGQFQIDSQGYLVSSSGLRVQGYPSNQNGGVLTGQVSDIKIPTNQSPPTVTSLVSGAVNLDSRSQLPAVTNFDPTNSLSYNNSSSVTVYDSLGTPHTLTNYYVLQQAASAGTAATWSVHSYLDKTAVTSPTSTTLTFDGTGSLSAVNGTSASGTSTASTQVTMSAQISNGANSTLSFKYDFAGSTQFGSNFTINALSQNGVGPGTLSSYTFNSDGTLMGTYSNGKQQALGQLVLTSFMNPNGLARDGNNTWVVSALSGLPQTPVPPGSSGTGQIQGSATENSNVDLTQELVHLITAQRNYQAAAQAIKTTDQVVQSLNNI